MSEPLSACPSPGLHGRARVPGDKSISHRALMLGALAIGETTISGLLEAEDVINTARAMAALGADVERWRDGTWHVRGVGIGGFRSPDNPIDFGNSGTGARLTAGLIATTPVVARLTGDASLRKRPMGRIIAPLERMGARFDSAEGGRLPLTLTGARGLMIGRAAIRNPWIFQQIRQQQGGEPAPVLPREGAIEMWLRRLAHGTDHGVAHHAHHDGRVRRVASDHDAFPDGRAVRPESAAETLGYQHR